MRSAAERLDDILVAIGAIQDYMRTGLQEGQVYDAVRMRLVEIGEATKALDPALRSQEPGTPWQDIIRMRDFAVHHYFNTLFPIVDAIVQEDLPPLAQAVRRLRTRL